MWNFPLNPKMQFLQKSDCPLSCNSHWNEWNFRKYLAIFMHTGISRSNWETFQYASYSTNPFIFVFPT